MAVQSPKTRVSVGIVSVRKCRFRIIRGCRIRERPLPLQPAYCTDANRGFTHDPDACDSADMAQTVSIIITSEDRARLAAVIEDRNSAQKHVQRAGSFFFRQTGCPFWRWPGRSASAARRYGAGNCDMPSKGWMASCGTGRASLAKPLSSWRPWPRCWRCRAPSRPAMPRTGPAARSPKLSASACGRCNASGTGIAFNLIACAHSRNPTIPPSPRRWRMSSARARSLSCRKASSSPPTSPPRMEYFDIFSPPPGDNEVMSQTERLSSKETKIAPRSVRIAIRSLVW